MFSSRLIDCTSAASLFAGIPCASIIAQSPTAQALLAMLDAEWTLETADLNGDGYIVDADAKTITLDTGGLSLKSLHQSAHFQNALIINALSSLRAAWHVTFNAGMESQHRPDVWVLLARMRDADIETITTRMIWELREEGHTGLWHYWMGEDSGDMALRYAETQDMEATAAQFFYHQKRIMRCDQNTLAMMDDRITSLQWTGQGKVSVQALRCIAIDPLTQKPYIHVLAEAIAGDPAWSDIADPINQAHFLQIMDDIGATRVGAVAVRDAKLAARLFPDALIHA